MVKIMPNNDRSYQFYFFFFYVENHPPLEPGLGFRKKLSSKSFHCFLLPLEKVWLFLKHFSFHWLKSRVLNWNKSLKYIIKIRDDHCQNDHNWNKFYPDCWGKKHLIYLNDFSPLHLCFWKMLLL